MADHVLTIADGRSDHAADEVGLQGGIHTIAVLNDAYSVLTNDKLILSPIRHAWTDPLSPPRLPVMQLSARTGERLHTDSDGVPLSSLTMIARAGSRADDMVLSQLTVSAAASHETLATGSPKLPTMSLDATTGIRCGSLKFPTLGVSATVHGGLIGTLNKQLPGITVLAAGSSSADITLDAGLPALEASITMSGEVLASLSATLPTLLATVDAFGQREMTLFSTLPALQMAGAVQPGSMTLSGTLPTLVTAEGGTGQSVLQIQSRFNDYVLRHER